MEWPTATQAERAGQETPMSCVCNAPHGLPGDCIVHFLPFHRPITGTKPVPVLDAKLTAVHADGEEHEMLSGVPAVTLAGFG